ncbi:hypothetical protein HU830_05330 [Lactobacillus sp. DCY120]|uniref:Uncharacterized protein n=1 Tax=Bombilactobacillus apium TaxID=2675299 RepID=A0A850QXN5_9LACO|nr:hypothetical protein [Bombilactobacillus apium]NVY96584.1 hypothetical protein [Bombilactobacillus apium]
MENKKQRLTWSLVIAIFSLGIFCFHSQVSQAATTNTESISSEQQISQNVHAETFKPFLYWHFKSINGHVYKRLYDHTNLHWIGGWIRV